MTRMYIQPSFIDSCSDHGEWSGGNGQYRGDRSADISTYDRNGRARVEAFSDEAIEARKNRKQKRSVRDKLVPQHVRLDNIEKYMQELEEEYDNGDISTEEYVQLYRIAEKKHKRAYELLAKAYGWQEQDDREPLAQHEDSIEQINYTSYNESPIVNSWHSELFHSLNDSNIFKIAYIKIKRITEALK